MKDDERRDVPPRLVNGYEREHACPSCARTTRAATDLCAHCRPSAMRRGEVKCWYCEQPTTAKSGVCRTCCRTTASARPCVAEPLEDGEWVRKGLVYVWISDSVAYARPPGMSEGLVMMATAKNEATRTADCSNSRRWPGSRRPHPAKNGSD